MALKSMPKRSLANTGSGNISTANVPFVWVLASFRNSVMVWARHSVQLNPLFSRSSVHRGAGAVVLVGEVVEV